MAQRKVYICSECGYESTGWLGRCPACTSWNCMEEKERVLKSTAGANKKKSFSWLELDDKETSSKDELSALYNLEAIESKETTRKSSGLTELDNVLGGGFVPGSLVLVGGEPGIGKSTLLLQVCAKCAFEGDLLYVCGEESIEQIKLRAERLLVKRKKIKLYPEIIFEKIAKVIQKLKPSLCVIDSIQTLYSEEVSAAPSSVTQIREVSAGLLRLAKKLNCTIVLLGHVTKEGSIAGPRILEHMVDSVLYFEGDGSQSLRLLRAVKNRFGATNELGIFEMQDTGLKPVDNGSSALLETKDKRLSGSAITALLEGTRPLFIEVQALLNKTNWGTPQRMAQGFDRNRLSMLLAVIEKYLRLPLGNMDAFVNVTGGLKINETSADLALCAALISSYRNMPLRSDLLILGEVGLSGEIRSISNLERRLIESYRLGFKHIVIPKASQKKMKLSDWSNKFESLTFVDTLMNLEKNIFSK